MKKRILSLVVILSVISTLFLNVPGISAEEIKEYTDGNGFKYHYSLIGPTFFNDKQYSSGIRITNVSRDYNEQEIAKDIVFPEEINGVKVTQIDSDAIYFNAGNIKNVYLPQSIEHISSHYGAQILRSNTLLNIFVDENNSFYKSLDGVLYSEDGTRLYSYPAGRNSEYYEISSTVTCIESGAFTSCKSITKVKIPPSLTKLAPNAFKSCINLTDISLPFGLQSIGEYAFDSTNLKSIIIPDSVTEIGLHAFYNCDNLEEVRLSVNLKNLGKKHHGVGIFHGCEKLKRLIIPNGVEGLYAINNSNAYEDCDDLKIFSIPKSVKECNIDAIPKGLQYLYYGGSESDWEALLAEQKKDTKLNERYNKILNGCKIFYNTDLWKYIYADAIKVMINDVLIAPAEEPIIENDRTLMPLRAIFETVQMTVGWNAETSTVTATGNGYNISMKINDTTATVNGNILTMDVPAKIINGRTFVPLRFIAESIGAQVDWDGENRTVYIKYTPSPAVKKAQIIYDTVEESGGQSYLNDRISLYNDCYNGAKEAFDITNDINKVYNTVGYLSSTTISIGSLCVGNVAGTGKIIETIAPSIAFDVASNKIKELCCTDDGFVCFMLLNANKDAFNKFADYHTSLNRDTMTRSQAIEYLTLYYEAQINNETILMAFKYFANQCPENFGEALLNSAKAAFGPIITTLTGNAIVNNSNISSLTVDITNFFYGNSLTLLSTLGKSNNEIISNWANRITNLKNEFNSALYDHIQ